MKWTDGPFRYLPGQVRLEERDGVYVHSFICNTCNLHFNIYSWKADHHTANSVTCPQCRQRGGSFRHWRTTRSTATAYTYDPRQEIMGHVPLPDAAVMDDSTPLPWVLPRPSPSCPPDEDPAAERRIATHRRGLVGRALRALSRTRRSD